MELAAEGADISLQLKLSFLHSLYVWYSSNWCAPERTSSEIEVEHFTEKYDTAFKILEVMLIF